MKITLKKDGVIIDGEQTSFVSCIAIDGYINGISLEISNFEISNRFKISTSNQIMPKQSICFKPTLKNNIAR